MAPLSAGWDRKWSTLGEGSQESALGAAEAAASRRLLVLQSPLLPLGLPGHHPPGHLPRRWVPGLLSLPRISFSVLEPLSTWHFTGVAFFHSGFRRWFTALRNWLLLVAINLGSAGAQKFSETGYPRASPSIVKQAPPTHTHQHTLNPSCGELPCCLGQHRSDRVARPPVEPPAARSECRPPMDSSPIFTPCESCLSPPSLVAVKRLR